MVNNPDFPTRKQPFIIRAFWFFALPCIWVLAKTIRIFHKPFRK
jgi:hypothetical protein